MVLKKVREYLLKHNLEEQIIEGKPGEPWHNDRYIESLIWIEPFLKKHTRVLELGGKTIFSTILKKFYFAEIDEVPFFDLRYDFPIDSDSYDLVLCMEVIEHVKDQETVDYVADFTSSGIINMLLETSRILKKGGKLFISTQNVCSYKNFENLLKHSHPYFYSLHHRELSISDLKYYISGAKLNVIRSKSVNVWNNHEMDKNLIWNIKNLISELGFSTDFRDDCLFMLCEK